MQLELVQTILSTFKRRWCQKHKNYGISLTLVVFRYLSYDEVLSTFASAGVTQDTIVGSVKQDFEQMNQKAEN